MELEDILKNYPNYFNFRRLFLRDLAISKKEFFYFLLCFIFSTIPINFIIFNVIGLGLEEMIFNVLNLTSLIVVIITIVIGGLIVDIIKSRLKLLIISSCLVIIGMLFVALGTTYEIIGYSFTIFFTGIFFIDLLTILIHESNILNRGRLIGYLFFLSFLISHIILLISSRNIIAITFFETILFFLIDYGYTQYQYKETDKRLKSDKNFIKIISKSYNMLGYLLIFVVFGFIFGNTLTTLSKLDILTPLFLILFTISFILFGVSLDNLGRKLTLSIGILTISTIIIFAGIFNDEIIYNSIFLGISIPITFTILFTFAADFSTERNSIKYRGRIICIFLLLLVIGALLGSIMNHLLTHTYLNNPEFFYWLPQYLIGLNPFLLILVLTWISLLPEILSAKEADWAKSLKNLYVFNKNSVCLYTKNFLPDLIQPEVLDEDLITGGFTGILTLLEEITNEKKNVRIIDKEKVKIYFAYGKSVIVALISTKYLPILFKKLDIFIRAFEKQFEDELLHFQGKINPFDDTIHLIRKFFQ